MILTQAELEALAKLLITKTEEMIIPILNKQDGWNERPNDLRAKIKSLKENLIIKDNEIATIKQTLSECDYAYRQAFASNKLKDNDIANLKNELNSFKDMVAKRDEHIKELHNTISQLRYLHEGKSGMAGCSGVSQPRLEIKQEENKDEYETLKEMARKAVEKEQNKAVQHECNICGAKFSTKIHPAANLTIEGIELQCPLSNISVNADPEYLRKVMRNFSNFIEKEIHQRNEKEQREKEIKEKMASKLAVDFTDLKKVLSDLGLL